MKYFVLTVFAIFICSCSNQDIDKNNYQKTSDELLEFAKANCFFWYFKKKNYDLNDIGSISGGIVEMGSYSSEKYRQVALIVKGYSPSIPTKQNIDIDLLKCFKLEKDPYFIQSLNAIN